MYHVKNEPRPKFRTASDKRIAYIQGYCNRAGGKLHYNSQKQYKCLTHSRGSEWCYSPALLCHQSILRNVQSDFTVLKPDQHRHLHCIMTIVFSHSLQCNSSFEPPMLSDPLFIQANIWS